MSSKLARIVSGVVVGIALSTLLFVGGIVLGKALPAAGAAPPPGVVVPSADPPPDGTLAPPSPPPTPTGDLFDPFWEAWDIVHEQYVDQPVDDLLLMQGAIRGMLDALGDPHTSYMDPDEYLQANIPLEGEYEGIGAWVDPEREYLTIISPMPGSPAEQVGLQPGDEIIAIDGDDMTGIDGNLVIRRVLGPAGSTVHLTIRRQSTGEILEVDIVRARIIVPVIESQMLDNQIAYVHLISFSTNTTPELRAALEDLLAQDPIGLILDLRGNAGGFLGVSIDVASEFIGEGVILIERFGDGSEQVYEASRGGLATDIPMVVLVDAGSASASEIVAGALQDRQRALLVGETTFGKGSVQNWVPLSDNQGAVRVTIARWYTPNEQPIHDNGLIPDVEVLLTQDDFEAGRDPQLEMAIELLLNPAQ
ncbi:MAG: S41 family peptidase [Anaerolineales bacterium]